MKFRLNKVMRLAALSAATTLGLAGQTHAALYQGTWDPAFGPAFPNLGWRATANLFVADDCRAGLAAGYGEGESFSRFWNPEAFAYAPCVQAREFEEGYLETYGAATVELRDVRVDFYNLDTGTVQASLFPDTYKFPTYCEIYDCRLLDPPGLVPPVLYEEGGGFLLAVEFDANGLPIYFNTSDSNRRSLTFPLVIGEGIGSARGLSTSICGPATPFGDYSYSARLNSLPITSGLKYYCNADGDLVEATGRSTVTPSFVMTNVDGITPIIINGLVPQASSAVPEPTTFALAGLALMLAAAARRKRQA